MKNESGRSKKHLIETGEFDLNRNTIGPSFEDLLESDHNQSKRRSKKARKGFAKNSRVKEELGAAFEVFEPTKHPFWKILARSVRRELKEEQIEEELEPDDESLFKLAGGADMLRIQGQIGALNNSPEFVGLGIEDGIIDPLDFPGSSDLFKNYKIKD